MISSEKLNKIYSQMENEKLTQMLVSDPAAVFYLTGKWIFPGERFMALLLQKDKKPVFIVNELFAFSEDIGAAKVYFKDTDDITLVLQRLIDKGSTLGVDKIMPARFILPIQETKVAANLVNCSPIIDEARSLKDEEERQLMREASVVNDKAMDGFKGLLRTGITELEVADSMLKIYKDLGASAYSFEPIVAFGANAADPHHMPDETKLSEGDGVLFDVGCILNNYCSDMTRTFFWKKEPTAFQKEIYALVLEANEEAEKMLQPGISIASIDKRARDIITKAGHGAEFTHRLGHFIGIETHEAGDVSQANKGITRPGNIFSIEPGVYVTGKVGVRIEDLAMITEDGCEILNHYSKKIETIS